MAMIALFLAAVLGAELAERGHALLTTPTTTTAAAVWSGARFLVVGNGIYAFALTLAPLLFGAWWTFPIGVAIACFVVGVN